MTASGRDISYISNMRYDHACFLVLDARLAWVLTGALAWVLTRALAWIPARALAGVSAGRLIAESEIIIFRKERHADETYRIFEIYDMTTPAFL
jgi:hypothetical protein